MPNPHSITEASSLHVHAPRTHAIDGGTRITFSLEHAGHTFELFYDVLGSAVATDGSSSLAALLPLAMKQHWQLNLQAPASSRLLRAVHTIQDMFALWEPGSASIEISDPGTSSDAASKAPGCATFFSGGVDSFYTLLKNRARITHLIFVVGFDIVLANTQLIELVTREIQAMANDLALPLIIVRTNLRDLSNPLLNWRLYHGAAMASVAHLLAPTIGSVLVASSHDYSDLFPLGTHPLLDPLWSTESVEVIHDGCEAPRFRKVAFIATNPVVQKRLRVCYRNKHNKYNCGVCEKCLRTMVSLQALGVLDRYATFQSAVNLKKLRKLRVGDDRKILPFHRDNLLALQERKDQPHLIRAVRQAMKKPGLWRKLRKPLNRVFSRRTLARLLRPVQHQPHNSSPFA